MLVFLQLLQQKPLIVEVVKQPPITPPISYGSVLLSAVTLVGVILLSALVIGVLVGAGIIWFKKRGATSAPPAKPGHAQLGI